MAALRPTGRRPRWAVRLHAGPIRQHGWFVLTALSTLAHEGHLTLSVQNLPVPAKGTAWFEVEDLEQKVSRTVNVDASDFGRLTSPERTELADVTLKRSYDEAQLPDHARRKVRPLGLTFRCTSGFELLPRLYGLSVARALKSMPWKRRVRWAVRAAHVEQMTRRVRRAGSTAKTSLPMRVCELEAYSGVGEPRVIFQVRAWDPDRGSDPSDREQVNDQRAELIRALRHELGPRFVGGFMPEPYARRRFPSLVSEWPTTRSGYLALVQQSSIGVSTRGLHGSNPSKLAEYFATGRAVVTEELHYQLPRPLQDGNEALVFRAIEDCVESCVQLLDDESRREQLQRNGRRYYEEEVRPDAQLEKRLLEVCRE
jgi:hypothetical protein